MLDDREGMPWRRASRTFFIWKNEGREIRRLSRMPVRRATHRSVGVSPAA
ncbi:hypothetical protein ACRAWF_45965 [Streptomyces sp. L7]